MWGGVFKLVLYRKWSLPVSVFILTIIAVAVSSKNVVVVWELILL